MSDEEIRDMFKLPKVSSFRMYCIDKWFEYKEEVLDWEHREVTESPEEYFQKYRWFLKEKFKVENK